MPKMATKADAELILKLYDLRREAELRKARNWWAAEFWPETAEDFVKVAMAFGTQQNNWLRQVIGYWEMAAALVVHGTLNEDLFLELSFSGEMFMIFAKIHPFLKELRESMQNPHFFGNIEKVIKKSKVGREKFKFFEQRIAARRKMMKEAGAGAR